MWLARLSRVIERGIIVVRHPFNRSHIVFSQAAGLELPDSFSVRAFDDVARRMAELANPNDPDAPQKRNTHHAFASAWNGVAVRLRAAVEYSSEFAELISKTTAPGGEERLRQETVLFVAISATQSCFECFCMACYAAGAAKAAPAFPLDLAGNLNRTPSQVAAAFRQDFPNDSLTNRLVAAVAAPEFGSLQDLRNTLAHRGIVPRRHYLSHGSSDRPSAIPARPRALALDQTEEAVLSSATTEGPLAWVLSVLEPMIDDLSHLLR